MSFKLSDKIAIEYLKEKGYEIKKEELIEVNGLKIKFEEWTDSYEDLLKNIPKGFRLMTCSELFKIVELDLINKITKEKSIYIYLKQLPIDKKNKWGRGLCLSGDSYLYSSGDYLGSSNDDGRVVFVKEELI